jgi:hypothetical protein
MTIFQQITIRIIKEQELIIGPVAWSEARKVAGLIIVDQKKYEVNLEDSGREPGIIDQLVARYERLFGRASHEVCREAVSGIIVDLKPEEVPVSLR